MFIGFESCEFLLKCVHGCVCKHDNKFQFLAYSKVKMWDEPNWTDAHTQAHKHTHTYPAHKSYTQQHACFTVYLLTIYTIQNTCIKYN